MRCVDWALLGSWSDPRCCE